MKIKLILSTLAVVTLAAGCNQNSDPSNPSSGTQSVAVTNGNDAASANADNSKINARDRGNTNLTALDQGNSEADIKTSASIRKLVVSSTNNFSTLAQNIKIITQDGKVTLRGPVANDSEKTQIDALAKNVVGDANVNDSLEVKTNAPTQ